MIYESDQPVGVHKEYRYRLDDSAMIGDSFTFSGDAIVLVVSKNEATSLPSAGFSPVSEAKCVWGAT